MTEGGWAGLRRSWVPRLTHGPMLPGAGAYMKSLGVPGGLLVPAAANLQVWVLAGLRHHHIPGSVRWILGKGPWSKHGGFQVFSSNPGNSHPTPPLPISLSVLASNPTVTYLGAKDTMTQDQPKIRASPPGSDQSGTVVEVTGGYYVSRASRQGCA